MQRWPHISCRFNCQDTLIDSPSKAAWCISFFGIHPTLTHVPPRPQADPLIQAPKFKVKKKSLVNPGTRSVGTELLKIYSTDHEKRISFNGYIVDSHQLCDLILFSTCNIEMVKISYNHFKIKKLGHFKNVIDRKIRKDTHVSSCRTHSN